MQKKINDMIKFVRRQPLWLQLSGVAVIALAGWWWLGGGVGAATNAPTFTARRGSLAINVLEGGSLQALESQQIKCEVRGGNQGTKILRIVDEGYFVTEDDVRTNKVLVELDSSDLRNKISQEEIQYQQALASLIDAQQNYEIQLNQNQSDIKAAEQKVRFARMDFDRFLGDSVTSKIVSEYGLDRILANATTNDVEQTLRAEEVSLSRPDSIADADITEFNVLPDSADHGVTISKVNIDFTKYANIDLLGDGEAKQQLRKFEDDLQVAQKELSQDEATLEGTQRLFDKGFVAKTELQRDQLTADSGRLKVQTAETARSLYIKYTFQKTAEQSLSAYTEAVRELDKARRVAIAKAAQVRARLKSSQGQYEVQSRELQDVKEQLAKCTIVAKRPGLVVYGSGDDSNLRNNQDPIGEGAAVRERQVIITIPDMTRMAVGVKIHESYIKKIKRGQTARITVDAYPNIILEGEVSKVGVLPDSQNRWMSPDLKVYLTTVVINGTYDWVKPGMSAKVEILINQLDDVVYIPVQSVIPIDGKEYCYIATGFKPELREVQVGEFNDDFIEIKNGLKEGERVLLRPPERIDSNTLEQDNALDIPAPEAT